MRYFQKLWKLRFFIRASANANLRVQHARSFLGRIWLLLNPLALAAIYFVLVMILARRGQPETDFLMYLTSGIFIFYYISTAISTASMSIVSSAGILLQQPLPALAFPIASVITAWKRFFPAIGVLAFGGIFLSTLNWSDIFAIGASLLIMTMLAYGVATLAALSQVFVRDTASALPLILRGLLYSSPVLYRPDSLPPELLNILQINPFFWPVAAWCSAWGTPGSIPLYGWLHAIVSAILIAGTSTLLFRKFEKKLPARL